MISARMSIVAAVVLLLACATTPRVRWVELPEIARFESAAAAERGLREVYQGNSFGSLVLAGNVVYGNPCSGATRVGGVTGETGVGGAAGETGVGGAAGETGVGGAAGETGVGGVTGERGVGGARGVVACSADLFRLPAGIQAYEFDGSRLRMVPQSSIVR